MLPLVQLLPHYNVSYGRLASKRPFESVGIWCTCSPQLTIIPSLRSTVLNKQRSGLQGKERSYNFVLRGDSLRPSLCCVKKTLVQYCTRTVSYLYSLDGNLPAPLNLRVSPFINRHSTIHLTASANSSPLPNRRGNTASRSID